MASPRLPLNPDLLRCVNDSGKTKQVIALVAGFPNYPEFYETLRQERVPGTPRTIKRLERVAEAVGFPKDEIFLDEARSA
jgi:hypothetical protein